MNEPEDKKFVFLWLWVLLLGFGSAALGLFLMLFPSSVVMKGYNATIARAFWGGKTMPVQAQLHNAWLMAVVGAGIVGWAIMWIYVAFFPFRRRERWAHRSMVVSASAWIILDIVAAAVFDVTGELWYALAMACGIAIPLALSWRYFPREEPANGKVP